MAKDTHKPAVFKIASLRLRALENGGFVIDTLRDFGEQNHLMAAFSTLDETLAWLKANAGLPAPVGIDACRAEHRGAPIR